MLYDKIIIGAGLYGLYSALFCAKRGQTVFVLEYDPEPFMRATFINQARVHMGYHYPRSYSTAIKSAGYFERFYKEYSFCIHSKFKQIYATSKNFSWTDAEEFKKFCKDAKIYCEEIPTSRYFKEGLCDGAFLTEEYTYDAQILKQYFLEQIKQYSNITIKFDVRVKEIKKRETVYEILTETECLETPFVLNATYAAINQIIRQAGYEPFPIKYELCEIILCKVSECLKSIGLTVMDGPFFSIMPFGKTGFHSLTSVTFTPHEVSYEEVPVFACQKLSGGGCNETQLANCNRCFVKPKTAWNYMSSLARKYMKEEYWFTYHSSLFSIKPILKASEIDDSRPTVIKVFSEEPYFVSVLSGKINTVYDLDSILQ